MLIRFAVENFLSFKDSTEFSMVAGKMTRHSDHIAMCNDKRILKGAYIFGANAGGKSNLIKAADYAKNIVLFGLNSVVLEKKYFRIDKACINKPGVFQFDIYTEGHFYSYGFAVSYTEKVIEEEWLYRTDDPAKELCVFLRTKNEDGSYLLESDIKFKDKIQQSRFDVYKDDFSNSKMSNILFLSDIAKRSPDKSEEYRPFRAVMRWFKHLITVSPESVYGPLNKFVEDRDQKTRLVNLLRYFDTGVTEVIKKKVDFEEALSKFPETIVNYIKVGILSKLKQDGQTACLHNEPFMFEFKRVNGEIITSEVLSSHGNDEDPFEYIDESDGTRRLFELIPLFKCLSEDCVVLVDELDRSLHTKIAQEFINYFYSLTEQNKSQLIVTTHDVNLMDLNYLRQDEIWFVERQKDHSSKLYSLNVFKARFDKKVEKEYLLGRYGAVPCFRISALESDPSEEEN